MINHTCLECHPLICSIMSCIISGKNEQKDTMSLETLITQSSQFHKDLDSTKVLNIKVSISPKIYSHEFQFPRRPINMKMYISMKLLITTRPWYHAAFNTRRYLVYTRPQLCECILLSGDTSIQLTIMCVHVEDESMLLIPIIEFNIISLFLWTNFVF